MSVGLPVPGRCPGLICPAPSGQNPHARCPCYSLDIFIQMQILFTDVGYNIMVVADNEGDYKVLTKWAETIQPVKKESRK
jgi:hypothetical protein